MKTLIFNDKRISDLWGKFPGLSYTYNWSEQGRRNIPVDEKFEKIVAHILAFAENYYNTHSKYPEAVRNYPKHSNWTVQNRW